MARGDHVYVRRRLGYAHHGIDLGDGTVVHFTGEPPRRAGARVSRTSLAQFSAGGQVRRRAAPGVDRDRVVRRAHSRLGNTGCRLLTNNCEHLATWCRTGEARSNQVRAGVLASVGLIAVAAVQVARQQVAGSKDES